MKEAYLVNAHEQSKKFYIIALIKKGGRLLVKGTWGRIGMEPRSQIKYEGENPIQAQREFNKVLNTRFNHGYDLISSK